MSWPVPAAGEIAERYAIGFEQAFALDPDGNPYPETPDTRSPNTVFRALGVVGEETHTELYLYQRSLADELMPDTATEWLARHGAVWGVPRLPPSRAVGRLIVAGVPGAALPIGIEAAGSGGQRWVTVVPATIPAGGVVSIPAQAAIPGASGNLAEGVSLPLVSPVPGLVEQVAVTDEGGMAGGAEEEGLEAWRERILQRIREPGHGGNKRDYLKWAREAGAGPSAVYQDWVGAGSVGVVVAMPGPRVPTPAEITAIASFIEEQRPVTAEVVVVAAELLPVAFVLQVSPDTAAVRAAVQAGLAAQVSVDQAVGAGLAYSRLSAACSSATGEYAHRLLTPAADVLPERHQIPVLASVTFVGGYQPTGAP